MSRIWRRLAPIAAAGALVAGMGAIPAEAASPAAYSITIAAKVKYPVVTGDHLVLFKGIKGYGTATIHGQVKGAIAGDVATLLAEPFGAKHLAAAGSVTLAGGSPSYSFTVRPTLATKYEVQVTTGKVVDVKSTAQTVYVVVSAAAYKGARETCAGSGCKFSINVYVNVPPPGYRTESTKHVYFYLALGKPTPKDYTLSGGTASRARKINAAEFELSLTWRFPSRDRAAFVPNFCLKDTESRDGLGLPGRHGCGDKKVSIKQATLYLG